MYPILVILLTVIGSLWISPAYAQFADEAGKTGEHGKLGEAQTQRWKVGMQITATSACSKIMGYIPVPVDWPEQKVKVVDEDISPQAKISYRPINKEMKLMLVNIPYLPAGQTAHAYVTYEVTRNTQLPPEKTDQYVFADKRKLHGPMRMYLAPSPLIESRSPKIRKLLKEIEAGDTDKAEDKSKAAEEEEETEGDEEEAKELTPWEQVEVLYDWVQDNIEYKEGKIKGALAALRDGTGDCEELSSLFIALCRAKGVPARTVWVPGHCYAEFYLKDAEGEGHWFPCQPAGSRAFGGIPEFRPVLQKGDNFRRPDDHKVTRYLSERLVVKATRSEPKYKFIRETVAK
jgi:hypothetical protein